MPENLVEVLTNCYGEYGVAGAIENVRKLGLRNLEVAVRAHSGDLVVPESVVPTEKLPEAEIQAYKDKLDEHGVLATSVNGGDNMLDPKGIERVKKRLDICVKFGASILVGSAGEAKDSEERRQLYRNLTDVGDYAAERGITIAFETHPGITVSGPDMVQTMKDLDHPNLRLNFDTGNIMFYNEGADVIEHVSMVIEWVAHFHLKDSRGGLREWYFPALGDGGAVDFAEVGRVSNDAGFYGPFSMELEGIRGEPPLALEQRQDRLQRSVDHLRDVGFLN